MAAFQPASLAVTAWPDWVATVFQALVMVWLPANVHASVQPLIAAVPVLRMVTSATKPSCHWLWRW